jgi:hypothetical protein
MTTLKDKLTKEFPAVRAFKVKIWEFCNEDHPPSIREWEYTDMLPVELETGGPAIYTKLKHDKTTMQTGSFDLLLPVRKAVIKNRQNLKGKIAAYHSDDGKTVARSFECEVTYEPPKEN